jgi:hypothetical protein
MYYQDEDVSDFEDDLTDLLCSIEVEDEYEQDVDIEPGEMSILYKQCTL